MDHVIESIAACGRSLGTFANLPGGLALSLFLAGLGGGAMHCAGMCGPFVIGQVMVDAESSRTPRYGEWQRLAGAALLPYHLGRLTTYTALGATAGAATAVFASTTAFGWISGVLLILGAALMLAQAFGLAMRATPPIAAVLTRLAGPFSASPRPLARYGLGVVLGFLPCGLLYGALAAAAGTGAVWRGGLAMASFSLGTVPTLVAVGWGGLLLRRRWQGATSWIAASLLLINAALMAALATTRLSL